MIEPSAGSSRTESVAESSTSRSTNDSYTGPPRRRHQGMPPPQGIPPPHHGQAPMTGRGRGGARKKKTIK